MGKKRESKKTDGLPGPAADVQVDEEQAIAEAERKKLVEIRVQAQCAVDRHNAYLQAKESASAAKASWESAVEVLQEMCLARDESLPLLDGMEPEDWRGVRLDSLELPIKASALGKLKETGIETIGQLADYTKKHDLQDIPGIGEAKKTAIEASLDAFWKKRGDAPPSAASEPLTKPEEEKPDP